MLAKIKKFFLSFFSLNRKTASLLLFFILLGMLLPFHSAQAFVAAVAAAVAAIGLKVIILIIIGVSFAFLVATSGLLAFVTSPAFLAISYTTNPFVMLGWTLTRDLANMFFILVLVVIALATILRIGDYQAKKALPLLIIIALLINFTPVIAGVIIDFFNILMDFFLGEGIGLNSMLWGAEAVGGGIRLALHGLDWWDLDKLLGMVILVILAPLIIVMYNFLAGFIFLLLSLLFIMRPIALMMLVILSPIAFLAYILPATRSFWAKWWSQFISWCLVGVVASFFLYLTDQLAYLVVWQGFAGELKQLQANEYAGGIFLAFVPLYVILGFLILGFSFTITTSAAGASHIIGATRKAGRWAGKALAVKAGVMAAQKVPGIAHKFEGWGEKIKEQGEKKSGLRAWTKRKIGAGAIILGRETAIWGEAKEQKAMKKSEEKIEKETKAERMSTIKTGTMGGKIAALRVAIDKGESKDVLEAWGKKPKNRKVAEAEVAAIYHQAKAKGIGLEKDIACAFPYLHKKFGITKAKEIDALMGRIKADPGLIRKMHHDNFNPKKAPKITPRILEWGGRQIGEAVRTSDEAKEGIENLFEGEVKRLGRKGFAKKYPSAERYFTSSAAQGAGVRKII